MGSWHWCSLAFLFKTDRVGESLAKFLGPDTPFVEIVSAQSFGLYQEFDKPLLRVNVAQLKPAGASPPRSTRCQSTRFPRS